MESVCILTQDRQRNPHNVNNVTGDKRIWEEKDVTFKRVRMGATVLYLVDDEVGVALLQHPGEAGVTLRQKVGDAHGGFFGPGACKHATEGIHRQRREVRHQDSAPIPPPHARLPLPCFDTLCQ